MVHTYSEAAWARRRQRAIERGFIQQRPPSSRYMMVETALLETMKCMYRSIVLHREHDAMIGMSHHFARLASREARFEGMIGDEQYEVATRVHRRAGRAKHEVSKRMVDVSARRDGDDLVFCVDPWKGKVFPKQPVPLELDDPWAAWRSRLLSGVQGVRDDEDVDGGVQHECGIHDGDAAGSRGGREDFQLALRPLASLPELVFCISGCFARLQGAIGQEEDFVDCSSLVSGCQARYDQLLADDFDMLLAVRADRDRVRRCIAKLHCECHFRDTAVESDTDEDDDGRSSRSSGDSVFALPTDFVHSDDEGGNLRALRDLRGSVQSSKVHPCGIVAFR